MGHGGPSEDTLVNVEKKNPLENTFQNVVCKLSAILSRP